MRDIPAPCQGGFDFAKLDSKPAQFYLRIGATEKLNPAVRKKSSYIAGLIQAGIGRIGERIGNEPFDGEFRVVQVTAGQAQAPNVKFANLSRRRLIDTSIEQIELSVRDRMADSDWSSGRFDLA